MIYIFFILIALMRVIQSISGKKSSYLINDSITFFHYGAFYQFVSAILSFAFLFATGLSGFNLPTLYCSVISAVLFALDLYTNIEAVKGAPLVLYTMFAMGGLFIPCIVGIFAFDEPMNIMQWTGLFVFFISVYLLSAKSEKSAKKLTLKTLILLLLSFFVNGLVMVVQKYFAKYVVGANASTFSFITFSVDAIMLAVCFLASAIIAKKKRDISYKESVKILPKKLIIYGAMLALALFVINLLITTLAKTVSSAELYTVSSCLCIIISSLIGFFVFKEKLSLLNIIGLICGVASICIMNFC